MEALGLAMSLAAALALGVCGGMIAPVDTGQEPDGVTVVKVGVTGDRNPQWDTVNALLEEEHIRVELIEFMSYELPNRALAAGEIDLNAFQHKVYLEREVETWGYDIVSLGDTLMAPFGLYSEKLTSIEQLEWGGRIALPNDPGGEGRCFKILEDMGVLELDPAAGYTPGVADITENPLNLMFVEVEAHYTARMLPDVDAAFVGGAFALDNGLSLSDAIYTEAVRPGGDNPYVNVIACRAEDLENEIYLKVLAAYQSPETARAILETYGGVYVPGFSY